MIKGLSLKYTEEDIQKAYKQGFEKGSDYVKEYIRQNEMLQNQREEDIQILSFNDGHQVGKKEGYKDDYKDGHNDCSEELHSIFGEKELEIEKESYQEGYAQAYSEIHAPTTERERQLQEKAWDEGYVSAIEDYLTQGGEFVSNVDCCEFRYEAGAEQFIKENMDNIKSYTRVGDVVSIELYDIDCEHTPNKETQEAMQEVLNKNSRKHSHYFKDVRHLDYVDVYQVNKLFPVKDDTDCILHARKKLLVCGGRGGGKDMLKDVTEAYDTLKRYLEIEGQLDD